MFYCTKQSWVEYDSNLDIYYILGDFLYNVLSFLLYTNQQRYFQRITSMTGSLHFKTEMCGLKDNETATKQRNYPRYLNDRKPQISYICMYHCQLKSLPIDLNAMKFKESDG